MKLTRKKTLVLSSSILAVILALAAYGHLFALPPRFSEVAPGVLYRSGQPNSFQLANAVHRYKIKTIVFLRETESGKNNAWYDAERNTASRLAVRFIYWPTDSHSPPPQKQMIDFLNLTQNKNQIPILVHCAQGKHRTGFFVGLYRRVIDNWSFDQVWTEMNRFDFGNGHLELLNALKSIDPEKLKSKMNHKIVARIKNEE